MTDQSPVRKTIAAVAALMLTVAGFQQLLTVPPAYAGTTAQLA